jgi:hypothetical protein
LSDAPSAGYDVCSSTVGMYQVVVVQISKLMAKTGVSQESHKRTQESHKNQENYQKCTTTLHYVMTNFIDGTPSVG